MDDAGRVTQADFVGGSKRSVEYTPERGFIKNIKVQDGLNNTLYTVDYGYNLRGDTKSRQSNYYNGTSSSLVNENYTYSTDGHFRLEKRDVAVTAPQVLGNLVTPMSQSFSYDSLGNLKTKSGVGTYEYDSTNPYLLRKTTGASAGVRSYVMTGATDYDAHGNIKADGQRIFMYNQADMVFLIAKGIDSTKFEYAPDNSRIYREDTRSGSVTKTWYVGKTYEYSEKGSITEQRWYLGNVVMSQSSKTSGTNFEVLHGDAQGSTVTVTDGSGKLVSHSLYDAWGQQSVLQVGPTSQLFIQSLQRRGYTGHENVEGLGIIHMNGRIYDPLLARFVQADPTLQFAQLSQGYNRYSYVLNNPMTYTDPSGYFVKWLMQKTGTWDLLKFIASVPILDAIITIGLNFIPGCQGWCSAMYVAAFQAAKTYAVTGSLGAGLRAGAISLATAAVSMEIGETFDFDAGGMETVKNIAAHSVVGGVTSVLQGGKFGHGFFSSMVSTSLKFFMEPQTGTYGDAVRRTVIAGMVGGTVSALTGGKFANGAITSAIQWWYNAEGNDVSDIYKAFGIGGEQALDSPLAEDATITSQPQKSRAFSNGKPHKGTDYSVPIGTDVMVTADGVVINAEYSDSFGKFILIRHKNGVYTRYAHGNKLLVEPGDILKKGTVIMKSGNSGISSGPHLHYEVFKTSIPSASNGSWSPKLDYSNYYRAHELNRLLK